jgi:EAL domain-containing protein (putative c-di-GMP-specific phosphodiesterase class I)
VDDFGTGYSSLAYLTRFPVSTVKVDRAFLEDIQDDQVKQAIVQAVTTLAHAIGMHVVAEGIETTEQLALARSLGCDEVQGYLVSKPLSADEATVWLGGRHTRELLQAPAASRSTAYTGGQYLTALPESPPSRTLTG